ncbi:MAG: hypothetical protein UW41_C0009G0003 [Candidatus Collierbacteria bacterium GW2011_GWC2_44_18]|uniref:PT repeat-containing protein n=2 Tax=Microgenomates group TaxID=1794810 RepID=A0A0G1J705_9BACT|nr:MAG: hypothetical protein UW16_C0005G0005 [Microgenomates group bacterium GW2011_GWC1_44_10]KKT49236.1 MAG: hypothetical protein UW41_C0009G0003 [Candidatus Collierbacteria bacterium GW2011_GWC2_44_18]KKT67441.1 MAG: hypothetical protein UW60_C0006G0005 [Candidatus Woesebacteria bacterium GW2011_GWA2_44_33]
MKFTPKIIISLAITFFVSASLAYAIVPSTSGGLVSPRAETLTEKKTAGFGQFTDEPKTEACPLNGKLYSKSEKTLWEARRPILAMIENDIHARPQSGLASADIVYEAVAEGGITRFMGVFYCGAQADTAKVAPVRSARIYFVNIAAEYNNPIYMHVGGGNCSADAASGQCTSNKKAFALEELVKLGWRKAGGNDFDTIGDIGIPVMKRDYQRLGAGVEIATEHTYVGYLSYAWREAEKRGFNNLMPNGKTWLSGVKLWKSGTSDIVGQPAQNIKYDFWANYQDFTVDWKYDPTIKEYQRNQGSVAHLDLETSKQITVPNIVVQFAKEEGPLDEHKHMFYTVIGEGTGMYFSGGQGIQIKWKKTAQTARTIYTDLNGKEITFSPGAIWISILPIGNKVVYN